MITLRQAYLKIIKAFPGGWDAMSGALGMTRDALENRIFERRGQDLTVQTALMMQSFTNCRAFAEVIANESGGVFIPMPHADALGKDVASEKFLELIAEIGELSEEFKHAVAAHEISGKDQVRINNIIDRINRTTFQFHSILKQFYCHKTKAEADAAEVKHA